jgi:hypothetical protein
MFIARSPGPVPAVHAGVRPGEVSRLQIGCDAGGAGAFGQGVGMLNECAISQGHLPLPFGARLSVVRSGR